MIWGSEAYPLAVYELFNFFCMLYRVFCFAVFLILLFPILLFLFFGQALNFSLVVPEPKMLSRSFRGGGGGRLEGQGPPDCLHTHLSAADVG